MMRWIEAPPHSLQSAVCDSEARPKVACRRTPADLSAASRHVRHADSPSPIPYTPAKKEGKVGGLAVLRGHGWLTTRRHAQT